MTKKTSDQIINCPNCDFEIRLSEALSSQISERLRSEFEAESIEKKKQLDAEYEKIKAKEKELESRKSDIDDEVAKRLESEKKKFEEQSREAAAKDVATEMLDMRAIVKEQEEKLEELQKNELTLRKKERELEAAKKNIELETERKLAAERDKIFKEAIESAEGKHKLVLGDLQNQNRALTEKIDELKRKADQGSQQAQGEVLELQLEELLKNYFPLDNVLPVPKGVRGADVVQEVHDETGVACGTIIWESKRTRNWGNGWIEKLKEDQRNAKADIAVILSTVLPKDVTAFGLVDGVWVTNQNSLIGLAVALRVQLSQTAIVKLAAVGKNQKVELLYNYLSGTEFKGRIESLVEAFQSLSLDLESERKAMNRIWAKREKQIQKVLENTVGMYGDMQGIIGKSLPEIEQLSLESQTSNEIDD